MSLIFGYIENNNRITQLKIFQTMQKSEGNPFIDKIKIPKTVYKFRDWTNPFHRRLLDGEIYLSSPLDFNDPFDCNIFVRYDMLQNNQGLQQEYFALVVERYRKHYTIEQKKDEVSRLIEEGRFNDPDWLKLQAKKSRQQYGEDLGVFCLTLTKKNILLWSHYASSHKGLCVGFNGEQLFFECLQHGIKGKKVSYSKEYPDIDPRTDLFKQSILQTHIKSHLWVHEKEYRLSKLSASRKTFNVSKKCFKEITLGCEITKEHRQEIIEFVKINIAGLPIYQAYTVQNKFKLSFERIE